MKSALLAIVAAGVLLTSSAEAGYAIRGRVVANGGANQATDGTYRLYGTAGQPMVGNAANSSWRVCHGFWCFAFPRFVDVDPRGGPSVPVEFALGPTTPNPTQGEARFQLALPKSSTVTLTVYDVSGRQVGSEVSESFAAGKHELLWRAPTAPAGLYFMRLEADGILRARRTIVVLN